MSRWFIFPQESPLQYRRRPLCDSRTPDIALALEVVSTLPYTRRCSNVTKNSLRPSTLRGPTTRLRRPWRPCMRLRRARAQKGPESGNPPPTGHPPPTSPTTPMPTLGGTPPGVHACAMLAIASRHSANTPAISHSHGLRRSAQDRGSCPWPSPSPPRHRGTRARRSPAAHIRTREQGYSTNWHHRIRRKQRRAF